MNEINSDELEMQLRTLAQAHKPDGAFAEQLEQRLMASHGVAKPSLWSRVLMGLRMTDTPSEDDLPQMATATAKPKPNWSLASLVLLAVLVLAGGLVFAQRGFQREPLGGPPVVASGPTALPTKKPTAKPRFAPTPVAMTLTGELFWPTESFTVTQGFWDGHRAIDIAGAIGQPIYAAADGCISFAGWMTDGRGYMIALEHGKGEASKAVQTVYAQLSQYYADAGQCVKRGATIAAMGATGNATKPHLHFEVRINNVAENPYLWLSSYSAKYGIPATYVVKPGDTCSAIAQKFNINFVDLMSLNQLDQDCNIQIGQQLAIPNPAQPPAILPLGTVPTTFKTSSALAKFGDIVALTGFTYTPIVRDGFVTFTLNLSRLNGFSEDYGFSIRWRNRRGEMFVQQDSGFFGLSQTAQSAFQVESTFQTIPQMFVPAQDGYTAIYLTVFDTRSGKVIAPVNSAIHQSKIANEYLLTEFAIVWPPTNIANTAQIKLTDFHLSTTEAAPGERITATWSFEGAASKVAILLPRPGETGEYLYSSSPVTRQTASLVFTVPALWSQTQAVQLSVNDAVIASVQLTQKPQPTQNLAKCNEAWFLIPPPSDCPAGPITQTFAAVQVFEGGRMFWFQHSQTIAVLYETDGFSSGMQTFADNYAEGTPEADPSLIAPTGKQQPRRGFGWVWRTYPAVRQRLGWALQAEQGFNACAQNVPPLFYFIDNTGYLVRLVGSGETGYYQWDKVAPREGASANTQCSSLRNP